MLVLGLGGKPKSGKSTAGDAIAWRWPETKIYSISDLICAEMGLKRNEVKNVSVLQEWSERRRKEAGELYWANKVKDQIEAERPRIAVIPNVRTFPEVALTRYFTGHLVRYRCLDVDGSEYMANDRNMAHRLETELDEFNWDFHITARMGQRRLVELQTISLVMFLLEKQERQR